MDNRRDATDIFRTDLLADDPYYNFVSKMSVQDNFNNNQESFFSNSNDSPYNGSTFDCKYMSSDELKNSINKNDFLVMSLNVQSLNAKFDDVRKELNPFYIINLMQIHAKCFVKLTITCTVKFKYFRIGANT